MNAPCAIVKDRSVARGQAAVGGGQPVDENPQEGLIELFLAGVACLLQGGGLDLDQRQRR